MHLLIRKSTFCKFVQLGREVVFGVNLFHLLNRLVCKSILWLRSCTTGLAHSQQILCLAPVRGSVHMRHLTASWFKFPQHHLNLRAENCFIFSPFRFDGKLVFQGSASHKFVFEKHLLISASPNSSCRHPDTTYGNVSTRNNTGVQRSARAVVFTSCFHVFSMPRSLQHESDDHNLLHIKSTLEHNM